MTEKKPEWAVNLSAELKSWVKMHGYKASTELADELSIPRGTWSDIYKGSAILAGGGRDNKFDGRLFYARINLWTELVAADPRNIPDRFIRLPGGGVVYKKRNLSEDEYQSWLKSPEAQSLLAKRDERFKREVIMEPTTPKSTPAETVGLFVGSMIDNIINRGADQIANLLLEHQTKLFVPQISALENRVNILEDVITRLAEQSRTTLRG